MRTIAIAISILSLGAFTSAFAGEIKNTTPATTASDTKAKAVTASQAKTCPAEGASCCSDAKNAVTKKSQAPAKGAMLLVRR